MMHYQDYRDAISVLTDLWEAEKIDDREYYSRLADLTAKLTAYDKT